MNKRKKIQLTVGWILVVLWMGLIYWFSAQVADESSALSGGVLETIFSILRIDINAPENAELVDEMTFIIRKLAHFTEYTILGILCVNVWSFYSIRFRWIISWGMGSLYAVSDEIHQLFVEGRSCELRDMLIDSSGVLLGTLIGVLVIKIIFKNRLSCKNDMKEE